MKKLEVIKKTIYRLENNLVEYDWSKCNSCNCGVLASTCMGRDITLFEIGPEVFSDKIPGPFAMKAYCMVTGIGISEVIKSLMDAGFTFDDIKHLEFLSDAKISERAGIKLGYWDKAGYPVAHGYFNKKDYLIKYLKAWVEILEEEAKPVAKERIVYVAVSETITTDNLILN